jgi:hypothetical protein
MINMILKEKYMVIFVSNELHKFLKEESARHGKKKIADFIADMAEGWGYGKELPR